MGLKGKGNEWLLIKTKDAYATQAPLIDRSKEKVLSTEEVVKSPKKEKKLLESASLKGSRKDENLELYRPLVEISHLDSARQSQIEPCVSERGSPSQIGKGDEEDRFGKAVASPNGKFQLEDGITHQDKLYWPKDGYTKGDLIEYYHQVAPLILPYLIDRPQILKRYPNGIEGESFYQKEAGNIPKWLRTESIQHDKKSVHYLFIEDEKSLLFAANLGCIEFHPFSSRFQHLMQPDYLIIDLDPEDVSFDQVIEAALAVHEILEEFKIPSVCKTSGATGIHIYVPMGALYPFEEVKQFANMIVYMAHQRLPEITSLERSPSKRQKKVYLDYLQNNFGQSVAAPYSIRPLPGAPVSTPLKWSEVKKGLHPTDFTIKTALKRFNKVGDLFKPVLEPVNLRFLGKGINLAQALKRMK